MLGIAQELKQDQEQKKKNLVIYMETVDLKKKGSRMKLKVITQRNKGF